MSARDDEPLLEQAKTILRENDVGDYTVPTKGLYPFQWNWDSCLTALGFSNFDQDRAWREIETLFRHQWPDGMLPHIVFHTEDDGYFPGPDTWRTNRPTPTSGITQPPVAGFALRRLAERATDPTAIRDRVTPSVHAVDRWHSWFHTCRDPEGEGLVAIIHPWESGRDNSIDWDEAFERVPTDGIEPYVRRDLDHAHADHRPTKEQYDRFVWLLERFRGLDWDNSKLHDASPFRVVDPGFNAILIRSCEDLAKLAESLGIEDVARRNHDFAKRGLEALEGLWSERHGQYLCRDRVTGRLVDSASVGGILPVFAPLPLERARALGRRIEQLAKHAEFLVPSHDPSDPRFDTQRYWRGPVWLIINYMIADGLQEAGCNDVAEAINNGSLALIGRGGFAEYYDPSTGEPCGGNQFTWTAAMVLEILRKRR